MSVPNVDRLRDCLLNLSEPIAKRTHAAFYLRTNGSQEAVDAVAEALQQKQDCPLMRHELAYILGQMQNKSVSAVLASVLDDETDDVLVRHESAEALGALGEETFLDLLIKHSTNEHVEIAETCQIAVDLIKWKNKAESVCDKKLYLSVDPAPPTNEKKTIDELKIDLMNTSDSLFERYRAMFALRNMNSDEAAVALATGFSDKSALFRHEIAYVLGQMQNSAVTRELASVLANVEEHRMVRHEAAEALGAIGGREVEEILTSYKNDSELIVVESCEVALDNMDYWTNNSFENSTV